MRGAGGDSPGGEYERYRAPVLGMLAKRFPRLDADERLAIYHDAWTRVLSMRERGETIRSLRAYLLATTGAEALHALSRGRVPTPVGPDDPRIEALSDGAPALDEQVVTRDQARIARDLLDTLDERQRDVLKLRWDLQLSGSEVRAALGLSERQYRRLAEEGAVAIAERVEELESGQWSRRTRSLLTACLIEVTQDGKRRVGIASRRQREEAQRLLETDPHVAALYAEIRRSIRGATALLPLPAFAAGSTSGLFGQLAELAADARAHLSSTVETVKQQATSLYIRAADPAIFSSGPRPGTAMVAIAGTLALGGGAYATHEATSTPRAASAAAAPSQTTTPSPPPPTPPRQLPTKRADKPSGPRPKPEPEPTVPVSPQPAPAQPTPTPAQPIQPTQANEFGFED
jgi:RNA polymerase sigma factor (sigma-70 family)